MAISAIAPFVFLSKYGRKEIGIRKSINLKWLFIAFAFGLIASLSLHFLGTLLYELLFKIGISMLKNHIKYQ